MSESSEIIAKECRFAIHMPTRSSDIPDFHLVKEILHFKDGSTKPNIRFEKDYKRSFGITRRPYQNYRQKKEYEPIDRLHVHECTQSELSRAVEKALGRDEILKAANETNKKWLTGIRQLSASPYLYGSDITNTALIKYDYAKRFPDVDTPYNIAYFDIETDVLHGTNDPIMATLVYKDRILTVVTKDFVKGYYGPDERFQSTLMKHLSPYIEKYNFKVDFRIVEDTVEVIKECMKTAHEWSPDFLAIWNMDFDIPRIIETLEKYNVDPKDIFSDPRISRELRFCKYKKGSTKKITASGAVKPKNPSEQWHSLYCPAGFYVIDAMCSYRFVRQGDQELAYYSLDFVLNKELGLRKLNFEEAKGQVEENTLDWHEFMQAKYPFEYIVYNIFDCIGMLELETKTNDLGQALPVQSGYTDFAKFSSQTKKFSDKYYFFLLEQDKLVGTVPPMEDVAEEIASDEAPDEDDEDENGETTGDDEIVTKSEVLGLRRWIDNRVSW